MLSSTNPYSSFCRGGSCRRALPHYHQQARGSLRGQTAAASCLCFRLASPPVIIIYYQPASQPASQGQQPHACSPRTTRPGRWAERQAIFTWAGHLQVVNNGVGVGQCARREHDEPWRSVWTVEAGRQAFQQFKLPIDRRPVACPHRTHGNGVRVIPLSPAYAMQVYSVLGVSVKHAWR